MKRLCIIIFCLLFISPLFARKNQIGYTEMDVEVRLFLPTINGLACGRNAAFGLRVDEENRFGCIRFSDEVRFVFPSNNDLNFSFSFDAHGYLSPVENDSAGVGFSLGAGVIYNPMDFFGQSSLDGISLFAYPMYDFMPFNLKETDYVWKAAVDIGVNKLLGSLFSVSPFFRVISGWTSSGMKISVDGGIGIGFFIPDSYK